MVTSLMVASDITLDLRVVDIHDLDNVQEVNAYSHPDPVPEPGSLTTFIHDTTITDDRVYISYWAGGVMIVDKRQLEAGASAEEITLNAPNSINVEGFEVHHSYPTADSNFLFIEDEVNYEPPYSQLRLFDIRDLDNPREVLAITIEDPLSAPHNLLVQDDLLFIGWYQDGVRIYRYDVSDPDNPIVEPFAFAAVRAERGEGLLGKGLYDGIYGVRLHTCDFEGRERTCMYASDLTLGLLIAVLDEE